MSTPLGPINLFEFETLAKERLPKEEYDYIAGGATDEISVDRNRRAYESWALRPLVPTQREHARSFHDRCGDQGEPAGAYRALRRP